MGTGCTANIFEGYRHLGSSAVYHRKPVVLKKYVHAFLGEKSHALDRSTADMVKTNNEVVGPLTSWGVPQIGNPYSKKPFCPYPTGISHPETLQK